MIRRDTAATAIKSARMGLQLSLRDLEARTKALQEQNPELYDFISRNTVYLVENQKRSVDALEPRAARAMLTVLFGSVEAFALQTGIDLHLSPAANTARTVPLLHEQDYVVVHQIGTDPNAPTIETHDPLAVLAVAIHSTNMVPVLYPGQHAFFRPTDTAEIGELTLLHLAGRLTIAYALPGGEFADTANEKTFTLGRNDSIVGVATSYDTKVPASFFNNQMRAAG